MKNGASDRLFRASGWLDPDEVLGLVEAEVHEELDCYLDDPSDDPALQATFKRERNGILEAVLECRTLYEAHGEEAFALMEESENAWSQAIGQALSSGDYMSLAI